MLIAWKRHRHTWKAPRGAVPKLNQQQWVAYEQQASGQSSSLQVRTRICLRLALDASVTWPRRLLAIHGGGRVFHVDGSPVDLASRDLAGA